MPSTARLLPRPQPSVPSRLITTVPTRSGRPFLRVGSGEPAGSTLGVARWRRGRLARGGSAPGRADSENGRNGA